MSFTYEDFYLSGFNTGSASISGIQRTTPLYWVVTGLKYNSNPVTTGDYAWFTGAIVADSGTLTPQSGHMGWDIENDEYRGLMVFDVASGLTATGCIELHWNSGGSVEEGYSLTKGFDTYTNSNSDVWNVLTYADAVINNAEGQHTHGLHMTGTSGGAWSVFYSQANEVVTGLALGTSGHILYSSGPAAAPVFDIPPAADNLGNHEATKMLDMNSYKITGLSDGVAATDAMAFGQKTQVGDLSHNSLANINAGTSYEHISQTQVDALHAIQSAGDFNHNDLANINAGTTYEHISQTQKDALHATYTDTDARAAIDDIFDSNGDATKNIDMNGKRLESGIVYGAVYN